MTLKTTKPAPGQRCGTSGDVFAGAIDKSQITASLVETQVVHLARRFRLPVPVARAVAEIHFGRTE